MSGQERRQVLPHGHGSDAPRPLVAPPRPDPYLDVDAYDPEGDLLVLNLGPQHPSTHGVLRVKLYLDGEVCIKAVPYLGYLHRGVEKLCEKLSYVATCPNGWSDWQAAIEVVAAAGKAIGIDITTNYPEWSVYQTVVTKSDTPLPEGYDIFMMWSDGAGPTQPWGRIRKLMSSEFNGMASNWNGNWGGYANPDADTLIKAIPGETDPAKLKEMYTELVKMYLTDIPSFTLMYRPQSFHTVNESVWTNFPHQDDGTTPPVPPLDLTDGWSIAGLYNVELVSQ